MYKHTTREEWLMAAVTLLSPMLENHGYVLPQVMVSCGWPKGSKKAIGQCFAGSWTENGTFHIFISPVLSEEEPVRVLDTLLHELIHAALGEEGMKNKKTSHAGKFAAAVRQLGLAGKPTATIAEPGTPLYDNLAVIATQLGNYPHKRMSPPAEPEKEKPHNWIKFYSTNPECVEDPYMLRVRNKSLAKFGPPRDPWGELMVSDDWSPEDEDGEGAEEDGA